MTGDRDDLLARFESLAPLARELNDATDHANEVFEAVEKILAENPLGVRASVYLRDEPVSSGADKVPARRWYDLAYQRGAEGWGLYVTIGIHEQDPDGEVGRSLGEPESVRIYKAPRDIRIEAIDRLDKLRKRIERQAKKRLGRLRGTFEEGSDETDDDETDED